MYDLVTRCKTVHAIVYTVNLALLEHLKLSLVAGGVLSHTIKLVLLQRYLDLVNGRNTMEALLIWA